MFRPQIRRASKKFFVGDRAYPEIERIGDPHSYCSRVHTSARVQGAANCHPVNIISNCCRPRYIV